MPEISDDELKQFNDMKAASAKDKADKEAKEKADNEAKSKSEKEAKDKKEREDQDLRSKVKTDEDAAASKASERKALEKAIKFNMSTESFAKDHADLLPSEVPAILKKAESETYDTDSDKAADLRIAIVEAFFAVQANLDLLTVGQKASFDEFKKLSKNGKKEKSEAIYENIFEPSLETLKKVKKAEELGKSRAGLAVSTKADEAYKEKLMAGSRKAYLKSSKEQ